MVKARWAVACLLVVVFAIGCSKKQTVISDGDGSAPTVSAAAQAPGAGEFREPPVMSTAIAEAPTPAPPVSAPASTVKSTEGTAGAAASAEGPQYKIGPEDQIRVSVWENRELTLEQIVRPDGKISMPLIQDVVAEGLTAQELAMDIQKKLQVYIKDPQVSVIVLQVNAPKYYVMGNVTRPGTYPLRSDTSVLQALSLAGGFTQFASPRSIKLVRGTGGKQQVRKINYYELIEEGGKGNYLLKAGDTLVVP